MKNVKYVIVLFISMMTMVSCSVDEVLDLLGDEDSDALIGTWGFEESEPGYVVDFSITFNKNFSGVITIKFTEEGETDTESEDFTWGTDGSQLTLDGSEGIETLDYAISGNKLTVTDEENDVIILTKR